ncbi:uncharacterized protein LOC134532098 isoform X2 [Bacillus rossius redtenbacheri]|uniref:uncharacterized protein LOC134532098 isoform X2 n=1 Tax=Bacillus rossius redtenbacheri TaxID=93214 RepID=UPI002FDD116A
MCTNNFFFISKTLTSDNNRWRSEGRGMAESVQPRARAPAPRPRKRRAVSERRRRRAEGPGAEPSVPAVRSETVIMAVLSDLRDDVVGGPAASASLGGPGEGGDTPAPGRPRGVQVYVQRARGFSRSRRDEARERGGGGTREAAALSTAVAAQERLWPAYRLCHGLLGGLALAVLILSHTSGGSEDDEERFVATLSPFVRVAGPLFFFLAAACTVSVLDRFDVLSTHCSGVADTLRHQSLGLAVLAVHVFTLASTLVCARWDDGVALYQRNASHWGDRQELQTELGQWYVLNACRCAGGVLGWALVVLAPARDLLSDHLAAL